jgi:hypothetical protein
VFRCGSLLFLIVAVILVAVGDALARLVGSAILAAWLIATAVLLARRRA